MFDPLIHGAGFEGFRTAIDLIADDLAYGETRRPIHTIGATDDGVAMLKRRDNIRAAVSNRFERDIREHANRRRPGVYRSLEWTAYTDRDFDTTAWRVASQMAHKDNIPPLATAAWGDSRIELREDDAYLVGPSYRLLLSLISQTTRYSSDARSNVPSWSPFVTDEAMLCLHGSVYGGTGDNKSVSVKKQSGAYEAMKRLVARHFHVDFVNVDPTVQAA